MSEAVEEGIGADASPSENKDGQGSEKLESGSVESTLVIGSKGQDSDLPRSDALLDTNVSASNPEAMKVAPLDKADEAKMAEPKNGGDGNIVLPVAVASTKEMMNIEKLIAIAILNEKAISRLKDLFLLDEDGEESDSGTEEDQSAFMNELENFFKEKGMEFKPPKFYGEGLNCLKLWRAVIRLGGYEKVTSGKLWRRVGESFRPPKTCTKVSWMFRVFYEKALLDYEKDKIHGGEQSVASPTVTPNTDSLQASGSDRARRDSAVRAMQDWSLQRLLSSGEVGDPTIKDKSAKPLQKCDQQLKSSSSVERKKQSNSENAGDAAKSISTESSTKVDIPVVDIGPPADWVRINVQRSKDCFEVYALVPGLLREEVKVALDPAGRVIISGEPMSLYNPWGVAPFKKVLNLPSRIDPNHTTATVMLNGRLYVRVPLEQPES